MSSAEIYNKLDNLPYNLKQEVIDFIDFLATKPERKNPPIIPQFGSAKGKIKMAEDFDAPLDDFKEYL